MKLDEIRSMVSDLADVEPKTFGTDADANEAAQWVEHCQEDGSRSRSAAGPCYQRGVRRA